ncbi:urea ABC transporter ATP-binding subunit UrtE [Pseudogemmobacter bohemicus]|uniref:urea ABC transporter ATP-binding subunit UrtE n=1 Tax=Pseudogemmobacter bohemicus TaxID=2250708 RepID=UPI000DD4B948|nr:urea ABC transporter ATP-binding subunit UrtE [Pseudogemmobacter bohemicus]
MLKTENLTLHYGGSQILYGLNIEALAGQVTCIMGTNGVGKTSLFRALSGWHPRSGGKVILDGEEIGRVPAQAMARKGLGYVPQGRMIFPLLSVRENLETAFALLPKSEHRIPDETFELFPILKDFLHRRGGDLSGGQQQQLAIARAMIMRPKVLLLDEPTEGIQPNIIQQIGRVIDYLRQKGDMAILLVEQYFDFAYGLADRFYVLKRGTIALEGEKSALSRETLRATVSV